MPTKISFTVVSSTGEDEQYRATDLNYHGPTVKGWRSVQCCNYPQDITLQLQTPAIIHKIQILAHQYLIPHKIEIWTCEDIEYDPSISPCGLQCFQYLGFITLSDNQSTSFKSRELKSVTLPPTAARFVKLRLHENHQNERNVYNQIGLVAVSVLGESPPTLDYYGDEVNNNNDQMDSWANVDSNIICNPQYTSPYDDLAFEMYVDKDVARVMRLMETKKHHAVLEERFEYARKLKVTLEKLREAGETLGRYEQEKRQAINLEDYDKAKKKKSQIEKYRDETYTTLQIEQLLELDGQLEENDRSSSGVISKYPGTQAEENPPDSPTESCQTPTELENDVTTTDHVIDRELLSTQENSESRVNRSPQRPRIQRRTSLTDYPSFRSQAPSPNLLTHSFSHTNFPTSSSVQHLRQTPSECIPSQFQCYTPYSYQSNLNAFRQPPSLEDMYQSLPPIRLQEPFYLDNKTSKEYQNEPIPDRKSPERDDSVNICQSPTNNNMSVSRPINTRGTSRTRSRSSALPLKSSYEAYEERMLPALRHAQIQGNDVVRECQVIVDQNRKSKLNERERKQAALPISVFGMELVEKFYSKHFADKEEGLRLIQEELKKHMKESKGDERVKPMSPNKIARASIFLLHRALRDKVYSVYSSAADAIRFFFHEYVPSRVSSTEVARSVEKLMPELMAKSGDVTPRIHNMAAHTLLSMVDCKQVRDLHIIPVHLSRPLSSSVHPRLALSRLEMVEQLILNHGISTEKQSGLTCRTLAEFGSSGLHHPAEAVRKVSERILIQVYKVNPRLVRKQLPPDDDVTRRNLLYRQLFQEFDLMDIQRMREQKLNENSTQQSLPSILPLPVKDQKQSATWNPGGNDMTKINGINIKKNCANNETNVMASQIPKRLVNQQTSPMQPMMPSGFDLNDNDPNDNRIKIITPKFTQTIRNTKNTVNSNIDSMLPRRNMARISEECNDTEEKELQPMKQFPNLVDSVHVAENRLMQSNNNSQNTKSIKYIFPTSYIGTSVVSQDICNKSNKIQTLNHKNSNVKSKIPISSIPILKNRNILYNSIKPALKIKKLSDKINQEENQNGNIKIKVNIVTRHQFPDENTVSAGAAASSNEINSVVKQVGQTFKTCIFCMAEEDWFNEETLNIHYWKTCPMLTRCTKCKEVVEISGLIQHRLDDCEYRTCFMHCERCQEAILKSEWDEHDCRCSKTGMMRLRCPLCHEDLKSEQNWRDHLMGNNVCSQHPRKTT